MTDKGLLSFIKIKLEQRVHPIEIKRMLVKAGFPEAHIESAFASVRKVFSDTHQDLVAIHDFLPPLSKKHPSGKIFHHVLNVFGRTKHMVHQHIFSDQKGLFVGRLRRKDFVIGFLFFFGVGYITLTAAALVLSTVAPTVWHAILDTIANDEQNFLLMLVPVILAPVTIISLSLIVRRLHNLELPGGLAFLFLLWFVPSFNQVTLYGFVVLEVALLALFVLLVTVKGHPAPNKYGPLPDSKGSFFRRILNI